MDFIHIYSYLYILTWQHSHTAQIVGRSPVECLLTSCTHTGLQALYTCLQVLPSIGYEPCALRLQICLLVFTLPSFFAIFSALEHPRTSFFFPTTPIIIPNSHTNFPSPQT